MTTIIVSITQLIIGHRLRLVTKLKTLETNQMIKDRLLHNLKLWVLEILKPTLIVIIMDLLIMPKELTEAKLKLLMITQILKLPRMIYGDKMDIKNTLLVKTGTVITKQMENLQLKLLEKALYKLILHLITDQDHKL